VRSKSVAISLAFIVKEDVDGRFPVLTLKKSQYALVDPKFP